MNFLREAGCKKNASLCMASQKQRFTLASRYFLPAPEKPVFPPLCWAAPHSQFFWNIKNFVSSLRTRTQVTDPTPIFSTQNYSSGNIKKCVFISIQLPQVYFPTPTYPCWYFQNYSILRIQKHSG
jgi:hypothetical protein